MRGDPYKTRARYASDCPRCGKRIRKGEPIIYWPLTRQAYHEACGADDFRRFQAEAQDEALYCR